MIDLVSAALHAAPSGAAAYPLAFGAGIVTSAGPCVAPRYVALAALVQAAARPWPITAAYILGLVAAMVALGLAADALAAVHVASSAVYLALCASLAAAGIVTLARGGTPAHRAVAPRVTSLGGVALLGASGALVVSPCCTPVLGAIAGLTLTAGRLVDGVALLTAYATGHALPLLLATITGSSLNRAFARVAGSHAPATVTGTLMLALAGYYGVLA